MGAVTSIPWTTNFRHLLPIPKKWMKRSSQRDPAIKSVRPKDRIKYWNIVPGDQIRVLGESSNSLHEVLSINRISNRVFVKGAVNVSTSKVSFSCAFSETGSYRVKLVKQIEFGPTKTTTIHVVSCSWVTFSSTKDHARTLHP